MLVKLIRSTEFSGGYWVTFWDEARDRKISCEVGPEFGQRREGGLFDLTEVEGAWRISPLRRRSSRTDAAEGKSDLPLRTLARGGREPTVVACEFNDAGW